MSRFLRDYKSEKVNYIKSFLIKID